MTDVEQATTMANLGKQALIDLLNNLTQAKEFVLAQAPDICQQYVALGRAECILSFIGAIIAALLVWRIPLFVVKKYKEGNYDEYSAADVLYFFGGAVPTGVCIAGTITLGLHSWTTFAAWIAPKIYLIRAISELVK